VRAKKTTLARKLIRSQNFYCPLCGKVMTMQTCNVDHILPKSRGGSNALSNLRLTHILCNQMRGNKMPGYLSELEFPLKNQERVERRRKKKQKRDEEITIDYTKMIQKRMDKYYNEVNRRYQEIHPLPL